MAVGILAQSEGLITVIYVKGGSQGSVRPDADHAQECNRPSGQSCVVLADAKDKRDKLLGRAGGSQAGIRGPSLCTRSLQSLRGLPSGHWGRERKWRG